MQPTSKLPRTSWAPSLQRGVSSSSSSVCESARCHRVGLPGFVATNRYPLLSTIHYMESLDNTSGQLKQHSVTSTETVNLPPVAAFSADRPNNDSNNEMSGSESIRVLFESNQPEEIPACTHTQNSANTHRGESKKQTGPRNSLSTVDTHSLFSDKLVALSETPKTSYSDTVVQLSPCCIVRWRRGLYIACCTLTILIGLLNIEMAVTALACCPDHMTLDPFQMLSIASGLAVAHLASGIFGLTMSCRRVAGDLCHLVFLFGTSIICLIVAIVYAVVLSQFIVRASQYWTSEIIAIVAFDIVSVVLAVVGAILSLLMIGCNVALAYEWSKVRKDKSNYR